MAPSEVNPNDPIRRLHIGGQEVKEGWELLNIQAGEGVDFIGDVADLSQFADEGFDEIYASHVIEHLGYLKELPLALAGVYRILKPGGTFRMSVPDLEILCRLFLHEALGIKERYTIMRMIFGGQIDEHDFHKVGLTWDFAQTFLAKAGFKSLTRVQEFGIFDDTSSLKLGGQLISLNLEAMK